MSPAPIALYDTLARAVVPVTPDPSSLGSPVFTIYACGPTVYRDAHVGNLRTFLTTDLIVRTAIDAGWTTRVVQNITDVGHMVDDRGLGDAGGAADGAGFGDVDEGQAGEADRLLSEAAARGEPALQIARRFEQRFHDDLAALGIRPAAAYPRASESIPLMIDLIATLLGSGHAYRCAGGVFFDARSVADYGRLSGNRLADLRPGHRMSAAVDPHKRFHADWALWKLAGDTRTQLTWDTPWGRGYPGWHIECSAMSLHHLGPRIDLHTGGIDLRFPHHEDERAQSNAAAGCEVVGHWVHGEHLLFEGRKMSKSAGNVVLLSQVTASGIDPRAVRLALMEHRYRQQMDLTWADLRAADATLRRWRTRIAEWTTEPIAPVHAATLAGVRAAMREDLDVPRALRTLRGLERDDRVVPAVRAATFLTADALLGLDLGAGVGAGHDPTPELPAAVTALLTARATARAQRQWPLADSLRAQLAAAGFDVVDTPDGQTVTPRRG
ncbi:MAG: class I tRNA ligase family protein [Actinomycetales bacterium]|nr:class I tRNA ligase family protein [Actinomycetales bacterium]